MTGFDPAKAYAELGFAEADYRIEAAVAIGRVADKSVLPEAYRAREAPSHRTPMSGLVFKGRFSG